MKAEVAQFSERQVCQEMLRTFYRSVLKRPDQLSLIGDNGTICHQEGRDYVSFRRFRKQSDLIYLYGHLYLEIVLEAPKTGGVLREYRAAGVDEATLMMRGDPTPVRLELVDERPCAPGQVIVKRRADQVFDWGHEAPLRTLKAVLTSALPYELVFTRDGRFLAALESNFRAGLLKTVADIFGETFDPGNEAKLLELTGDRDPFVAWHALRHLAVRKSASTKGVLDGFAASDVHVLASAARSALQTAR